MLCISVSLTFIIFHYWLIHLEPCSASSGMDLLRASSPAGNFLGYRGMSYTGKLFSSFSGIRYAKAPVDEWKFKDPIAFEYDKNQVVPAMKEGPDCMQSQNEGSKIVGEEDCLFLNIYSPNITGQAPVILYIFGGAFMQGSSSRKVYGPEYFMDENVVLVTINYRLGALGYASTEDEVFPGNLGQGDQAEAVRWIARNIEFFGGDPKRLTLMGHSSGASSVIFHLKSPEVKHLIKRGIAHSGSSLTPWATSYDHRVRNKTRQLASLLDCPTEDSFELISCLSNFSGNIISERTLDVRSDVYDVAPFRPVLNETSTAGGFSVSVPLLISFVETEIASVADIWASQLGTTIPSLMMKIKNNFSGFLVNLLALDPETPPSELEPMVRAMGDFYWGGNNDTSCTYNNVLQVLQAVSDIIVTYPTYREAQITVSDQYTFFFNYNSHLNAETSPTSLYGTTHTDELKYFFPSEELDVRRAGSSDDRDLSMLLVKMWVDFASERNPTPNLDWKGISNKGGYLEISNTGMNLVDVMYDGNTEMAERLKFWVNFLLQSIGKLRQLSLERN